MIFKLKKMQRRDLYIKYYTNLRDYYSHCDNKEVDDLFWLHNQGQQVDEEDLV